MPRAYQTEVVVTGDRRIPFRDGEIAMVDLGGDGPDVLLVHNVGENAHTWGAVSSRLVSRFHVHAMDLPGHGQTTAEAHGADEHVAAIAAVCRQFERVVVVADEWSTFHALAATVAVPGPVAGLVSISGALLMPREELLEALACVADEEGIRSITEDRYALGEVVGSREELAEVVEEQVAIELEGFLGGGLCPEESRAGFERSFMERGDGTWIRRPTATAAACFFRMDPDCSLFPSLELAARAEVPIHLIVSISGNDAGVLGEDQRYAGELPPNVTIGLADAGSVPRRLVDREVFEAIEGMLVR